MCKYSFNLLRCLRFLFTCCDVSVSGWEFVLFVIVVGVGFRARIEFVYSVVLVYFGVFRKLGGIWREADVSRFSVVFLFL